MCLIALAYKVHPDFPLIVAANRDEFLERPTRKLHFWDDAPHILAGRDERAGGTWMGLNLLYGAVDALRYHSNISGEDRPLEPGIHGLSNHLLNTPWPKVQRAKQGMEEALRSGVPSVDALFRMLEDGTPASPGDLPNTGLDHEWERSLSSIMIRTEGYGTRSSTVVLVSANGVASVFERSFQPEHMESIDLKFEF